MSFCIINTITLYCTFPEMEMYSMMDEVWGLEEEVWGLVEAVLGPEEKV